MRLIYTLSTGERLMLAEPIPAIETILKTKKFNSLDLKFFLLNDDGNPNKEVTYTSIAKNSVTGCCFTVNNELFSLEDAEHLTVDELINQVEVSRMQILKNREEEIKTFDAQISSNAVALTFLFYFDEVGIVSKADSFDEKEKLFILAKEDRKTGSQFPNKITLVPAFENDNARDRIDFFLQDLITVLEQCSDYKLVNAKQYIANHRPFKNVLRPNTYTN